VGRGRTTVIVVPRLKFPPLPFALLLHSPPHIFHRLLDRIAPVRLDNQNTAGILKEDGEGAAGGGSDETDGGLGWEEKLSGIGGEPAG
jgi:hypothetical protein